MLEGVDIPEVNDDPSSLMVTVDSKMDNSSVLMKIANPKIKKRLIVSDLDLHNPEDKALSLCLKMLEQRKKREQKQKRIIQQIRKSRVVQNMVEIGAVPKLIARDHFISRHEYLRESHYHYAKPRLITIQHVNSSQLVDEDKKKVRQRQLQVLQKSKKLTHRYQIKKIVQEILDQATENAIVMHQRKKRFFFGPLKAKVDLDEEKNWQRRAKGKKGSLSLSRVLDLKMTPSDAQEDQQNDDQQNQEEQTENNESSNEESSSIDESSEQSDSNEEKSSSQPEEQDEDQLDQSIVNQEAVSSNR